METSADQTHDSGGAEVALELEDGLQGEPGHNLVVVGHGTVVKQHKGALVAPESVLAAANVESLAAAARDERRCCRSSPEPIYVAVGDQDAFDEELFEPGPVWLEIGSDHVHACVERLVAAPVPDAALYRQWIGTAVAAHGCSVASVRLTDQYGNEPEDIDWPEPGPEYDAYLQRERARPRLVAVRVEPTSATTVGSLLQAGRSAEILLNALTGGAMDIDAVRVVLRSGAPHLLIGLPESQWFEAKGQPYNVSAPGGVSTAAKIELAQDVARFANGDTSGLLVIGLATNTPNSVDTVDRVSPIPLARLSPEQYMAIIDERVIPTVEGLEIYRVDLGEGVGLLVIDVPRQPAEYKPFLVHGAIVGDRVEGTFISIVRRRGEGSIIITASQIHAMLAAGRALLRASD